MVERSVWRNQTLDGAVNQRETDLSEIDMQSKEPHSTSNIIIWRLLPTLFINSIKYFLRISL